MALLHTVGHSRPRSVDTTASKGKRTRQAMRVAGAIHCSKAQTECAMDILHRADDDVYYFMGERVQVEREAASSGVYAT